MDFGNLEWLHRSLKMQNTRPIHGKGGENMNNEETHQSEAQRKTRKPHISQQTQTQNKNNNLLRPKSGTASSSPENETPSPAVINVMLWMKRNAYSDTTINVTQV